jgi:hypothetical protein
MGAGLDRFRAPDGDCRIGSDDEENRRTAVIPAL